MCNGGIINVIYDDKTVCNEFLMCIANELKDYNLIDPKDETDTRFSKMKDLRKMLENKVGRNLVFMNQDNQIKGQTNYGGYLELIDKDTILFILSNYYMTTNTQLAPLDPVYASSLTILLRNEKVKILKSRNSLKDENKTLDLKQVFRKSKLKTLSGK